MWDNKSFLQEQVAYLDSGKLPLPPPLDEEPRPSRRGSHWPTSCCVSPLISQKYCWWNWSWGSFHWTWALIRWYIFFFMLLESVWNIWKLLSGFYLWSSNMDKFLSLSFMSAASKFESFLGIINECPCSWPLFHSHPYIYWVVQKVCYVFFRFHFHQ